MSRGERAARSSSTPSILSTSRRLCSFVVTKTALTMRRSLQPMWPLWYSRAHAGSEGGEPREAGGAGGGYVPLGELGRPQHRLPEGDLGAHPRQRSRPRG